MLWGIGIYEASFQTSGANEHDTFSTEVHVIVHFHQEFGQNVVGAPFQKPQALHGVPLITFLNIQKYLTKKPLQSLKRRLHASQSTGDSYFGQLHDTNSLKNLFINAFKMFSVPLKPDWFKTSNTSGCDPNQIEPSNWACIGLIA